MLAEHYAGINTLHFHRVLLIFEELAEYLEELLFGDFWHKFNHIVQNDGCNFSHLRNVIL